MSERTYIETLLALWTPYFNFPIAKTSQYNIRCRYHNARTCKGYNINPWHAALARPAVASCYEKNDANFGVFRAGWCWRAGIEPPPYNWTQPIVQ